MRTRQGCGGLALGCLFVVVSGAVFAALAGALVLTGEAPLYAPRLIRLEPEPGYAFQPTTPITLTFDQPMDAASVEDAVMLIPRVAGRFEWNEQRTQVTFIPQEGGFEPGRSYEVRLAPGAKAGTIPRTTERGTTWGFSLPPLLDEFTPALGEDSLGAWTRLEATFNYPLECGLTMGAFSIAPEAVGVLECKQGTVAFTPTEPLAAGTDYVAAVEHVYLEGDPAARPGVAWEFRTAPPLAVLEFAPADPTGLDLWTPVHIAFNRPVFADSLKPRVSLVPEGGEPLAGQWTSEGGDTRFVFQPDEPLKPGVRYHLTLQSGVRDGLGFELAEPVSRSFDTVLMSGLPLPVPGSREVKLDQAIRVPFTRPMDKASVEAGLVISPALSGEVSWDEDTLVLTPRGGLAPETVYEITLSPEVRDASGAPLAEEKHWAFATEAFLLDAQVPAPDDLLLELRQPISLTFALAMDKASVEAALVISPPTPGELAWSSNDRTVTFQPDPAWLPGADYAIILSGSARTADRVQALGADRTWTFSTGMAEVQFGEGPNVQVLDAAGERAFQVVARGADVADFALYPITPTQFLDLYSSGFRGIGPEEAQIVDTSALTPTIEWRELLVPLSKGGYDGGLPAQAHIPGDAPRGMYLLASPPQAGGTEGGPLASPPQAGGTEGGPEGGLLVVLTRHALVLKRALAGSGSRAQAQVVAWDTEISGGAPVVSATLRLYDRDGTFLAEGQTGADGLLTLDVAGDPAPLLALSTSPPPAGGPEGGQGDVTVCGLGQEWSESGWWWWEPPPSRPLYTTYAYTDRPIYRPGQTVYFKDWLRADDDADPVRGYTLPTSPPQAGGPEGGLPVTVRLRDARDNVAATRVLTPTEFGTIHGEFQLADEVVLGDWHLETEVEGEVSCHPLKVEEYRKPEYEVTVQTPQETYVAGETVSVTVDAVYYFGQPVAGADVAFSVYPTYPDDFFYGAEGARFGLPILTKKGRTDEQGRWTVLVPTDALFSVRDEAHRDSVALALEATVSDDVGQSVSSYQTVVVQRTSQGLTLLLDKRGYEPNEAIVFTAQMLDRDDRPVPGTELTTQLLGWDDRQVAVATATTDAGGQARFTVSLAEQGWYRLNVGGLDDGGRTIEADDWLWIYDSSGQARWYQGRWAAEDTLTLSADRSTYAVGDQARLVINAPTAGPALLTFERGETRHAEPVVLVSGVNLITVPVRADFAPNIHVQVSQFGPPGEGWWPDQSRPEAELHAASTQLLVPITDKLLTVMLTTDQQTYAAGDEATFQVQVTDHQGQPVVAEVSLAVVDEAIYALAEDLSKDPFDVFYGPRPNLVRTFDSLRPTRWLLPPGLGGGGGEGEAGGTPRREFLDTAYWAPAVVTDENGQATLTFTLPDNLTEWRALARAVTTDTLVGQATARIVVSQDIVVRPALPRFLVQGDAITLTAVVHNFTSEAVSATVELALTNLQSPISNLQQVVNVPAGGSATAGWPVVAEESGEAQVTILATATRGAHLVGRDAVERSLPVHPLAAPEVAVWAGELTTARPTETLTVTLPADALPDLTRLELDLSPSLAAGLLDGLEYLIGYPYGCVEQTMSRALPNALVARAFRGLGIANERLEADLPPMIELGLQKLYGYQHNDGGWGWWYDDSTDLRQTAYVLLGLALTEQAGFDVDSGVVQRGAEALREMLSHASVAPSDQAYGAYALALAGQPFSLTLTLSDALQLDPFSQAALAVAASASLQAGGTEGGLGAILLDNLREAAIQDEMTAHWVEGSDDAAYSRRALGSAVRTTAMVADALVRLDPGSPLLPRAARWLMDQRQGRGWGDTQRTSYAILALSDYLASSKELAAGVSFRVSVNGELWEEGVLDQPGAARTLVLTYTGAMSPSLLAGENQIQMALGAEGGRPSGHLYYGLTLAAQRAPDDGHIPALQTYERSIGVRREYRLAGSDESATAAEFRRGDLVEVRLTLDVPEESWYVVVEDPLPAGLEALNERLGTTSHAASAYEEPVYTWQDYGYNRKQVRDDRVSFFVTRLEPGERTFTYLARATTAGRFSALPVQVYPMYEPEVWSRSDSAQIVVR